MILDHLDNLTFVHHKQTDTICITFKWILVAQKWCISDTAIVWNFEYKNEIEGVSRLDTVVFALI